MKIEFIDITSYRGISADAEHFYAKVGETDDCQEFYLTMLSCEPESGVYFINGRQLRYFPSEKEARQMWEKDNGYSRDPFTIKHKEDSIAELQEDGTIRFPSILAIVEKAREEFPDSVLCFTMNGSRKAFAKYIQAVYKNSPDYAKKLLEVVGLSVK